jgi:hypothetical protein|tara:strand:- start:142 stop:483 length:342 start_codon:yes stop_codon:yes gene_type:complete
MREFIYDSWHGVMDHDKNPLRHIPDLQVRHMIMQVLSFIWSGVFAVYIVDNIWAFGISAIAHLLFVAAIVITVGTFKIAEKSRAYIILRDKKGNPYKYNLPEGDKGDYSGHNE